MTPFEQFARRNGGQPAFRLVKDGRAVLQAPVAKAPVVIGMHGRAMGEAAREFAGHMATLAAWAANNFGADPERPTEDDVELLRGANDVLGGLAQMLVDRGLLGQA
jgi:hypothetical protein